MPFFTNRHYCSSLLLVLAMVVATAEAEVIGVHPRSRQSLELSEDSSTQRPPDAEDSIVGLIDPVLRLNRFTFQQTILDEHADEVPHWIVLFCPPWFQPCQALDPIFQRFTTKWQDQLNNAVLSTEVRFAAVDCATEKALCNTQNVDVYPYIAHYRNREQVKVWRGKALDTDEKRLRSFLQKELGPLASAISTTSNAEDVTAEAGQSVPMDFLLIFAAIAGNAWFISRSGYGSEASSSSAQCKKQLEGMTGAVETPPSRSNRDQPASCTVRSLPKEWAQDRPSLEL
jgi:thiol-disulfide isomerase/thioredoxin